MVNYFSLFNNAHSNRQCNVINLPRYGVREFRQGNGKKKKTRSACLKNHTHYYPEPADDYSVWHKRLLKRDCVISRHLAPSVYLKIIDCSARAKCVRLTINLVADKLQQVTLSVSTIFSHNLFRVRGGVPIVLVRLSIKYAHVRASKTFTLFRCSVAQNSEPD